MEKPQHREEGSSSSVGRVRVLHHKAAVPALSESSSDRTPDSPPGHPTVLAARNSEEFKRPSHFSASCWDMLTPFNQMANEEIRNLNVMAKRETLIPGKVPKIFLIIICLGLLPS